MNKANIAYDLTKIRADFPILAQRPHGKRLCFLDSGASAQKPLLVLNTMRDAALQDYANIHRGAYQFSENSTQKYEAVREKIRRFLGVGDIKEVIFGYNTTSLINLVAQTYPKAHMQAGDEIILSEMEHHANLVPWVMIAKQYGFKLRIAPIDDDGNFLLQDFKNLLNARTKFVAMTHVSNVLGTKTPIAQIIKLSHEAGAKILVDGSQAVQHEKLNLQALDPDFYVFTGHKLYGPTGIGILYGKADILENMPPFLFGGDMIKRVSFDAIEFAPLPAKFEAGTPPILESFGLGAAIDYVESIGLDKIKAHEQHLLTVATEALMTMRDIEIYGKAQDKGPVLSFNLKGAHPQDVALLLDQQGIAIRAGQHCAEPLHDRLGIKGSCRVSFGLYNGEDDIEQLLMGLKKAKKMLV